MPRRYESRVIADNRGFGSGETASADVLGLHTPAVCIEADPGALTDDTITVEIVGAVGTYTVDERTISSAEDYIVDIPQAEQVQVTSSGGSTITAEARNNPR